MARCDICTEEGQGTLISAAQMRVAVFDDGFNPFRIGLVRSHEDPAKDYALWMVTVAAPKMSDWNLCDRCLATISPYLTGKLAPTGVEESHVSEATPAAAPSWQKALIDLDLAALMRARTIELPPVPDNWKGGAFGRMFGGDKPWGTTEDAVKFLRGGKIEEGRELLRRLCKHTSDPIPKAVLAWELQRPPEDNRLSLSYLMQLSLSSCEFFSIKAIKLLTDGNYELGGEDFLNANEVRPASAYGCAMFLISYLSFSDLWFQTRLLMPRNRAIEGRIVTSPLKGSAQMMLRQHEAAWQTFLWGWIQSEEHAHAYAETLKVEMTTEEEKLIEGTMSKMCMIGMGLILWDLGFAQEAADIFARVYEALEGNLRHAAEVLAQ